MPQVLMPHARPTQLDALTTALNIGSTLYGIKYKSDELEQQKIAAAQQQETQDLQRSVLQQNILKQQKEDLASQKLSRGEFDTPLEAQSTIGKLGYKIEQNPKKENLQNAIPITISGQKFYAVSSKSSEDLLKESLATLHSAQAKEILSGTGHEIKLADLKNKQQEFKNLEETNKKINAETQKTLAEIGKSKFNNEQTLSAGFALKMDQADNIINSLVNSKFDPSSIKTSVLSTFPLFEATKSNQQKQYDQAVRSFVNSQLRRESGAAISAKEYDEAKRQYFPQIGDSQDVINQKNIERRNAIEAMKFSSGGAFNELMKSQNINTQIARQNNIIDNLISPVKAEQSVKKFNPNRKFTPMD